VEWYAFFIKKALLLNLLFDFFISVSLGQKQSGNPASFFLERGQPSVHFFVSGPREDQQEADGAVELPQVRRAAQGGLAILLLQELRPSEPKVLSRGHFFSSKKATTLHIPWRESTSRPIAPISSLAGEERREGSTRPRYQGMKVVF
jgi:hypothetical protein